MAKPAPAPVFTLQQVTPPKPTWWAAHRHQVLSTGALIVGFYLGAHSTDTPPDTTQPSPAHPATATTGP